MTRNEKVGGLLFAAKMAIGGAIGYEIFVYLGPAYLAGGSSLVSAIIFAGLLNLLTMLSYCELSGILPKEGGEYQYARAAFGDIVVALTPKFLHFLFRIIESLGVALVNDTVLD